MSKPTSQLIAKTHGYTAASRKTILTARECGHGACVGVVIEKDGVLLVDTKKAAPGSLQKDAVLKFTHQEIRTFIQGVKSGDFDEVLRDNTIRSQ